MKEEIIDIKVGKLKSSPTNPRKFFDEIKLRELADSIEAQGLLEPVIVRAVEQEDFAADLHIGDYEICYGERRARACKLLGKKTVPCIVRIIPDHDLLKGQLLENIQREELSPIEEAGAIGQLIDRGDTAVALSKMLGKSESYVLERNRLRNLPASGVILLNEKIITLKMALLIARLPEPAIREAAMEALIEKVKEGEETGYQVDYENLKYTIEHNFMLELTGAPFNVKSPKLIPEAGACTACPKRTGNCGNLFDDVDNDQLCLDANCFAAKRAEAWRLQTVKARENGWEVLSDEDSVKLIDSYSGAPHWRSGHIDLDAEIAPEHLSVDMDKVPTWAEAVGDYYGDKIKVGRSTRGKMLRLMAVELAREAARINGADYVAQPDMRRKGDATGADVTPDETVDAETTHGQNVALREEAAEQVFQMLLKSFRAELVAPHKLKDFAEFLTNIEVSETVEQFKVELMSEVAPQMFEEILQELKSAEESE